MTRPTDNQKYSFLQGRVSKKFIVANLIMAVIYFLILALGFQRGNIVLFYALIISELYHLFQIGGYCYTIWDERTSNPFNSGFKPAVDVYITVCGEPTEIVKETALAALAINYPDHHVYLLNDGYVANKDNWQEIEALAQTLKIGCITRKVGGGAKAGNINNAMRQTNSPYVVIFDADHVPKANFLAATMGYFIDPKMGFVQTPQFYKNQGVNNITQTAWDQQALFFGAILKGKNRSNSAFMCGTNMVLRREAINDAGGMCEFNIAEDFLTSLFVHSKGWNSVYVPIVLAEGLAPEDLLSYYKQQYRWTRGSLEVIFKYNPLLMRGLSFSQRLQYLFSASYFLMGVVVVFEALLPLIFLYTGLTAINTRTMELAFIFIPYIFSTLFVVQRSSNYNFSFQAVSFSINSFFIQIKGIFAVLIGQKTTFSVTSKKKIEGNFLRLVVPQLLYIFAAIIGIGLALYREGLNASLIANVSWVLINIAIFLPFIRAALPQKQAKGESTQNLQLEAVKHG